MLLGPGTKLGTYESRAPLGVLLETSLAGELAFVERAKRLIRAQLQRAAHDCGGSASATVCSISATHIITCLEWRGRFPTRLPLQNRRLPVERNVVTILGCHRDNHYRIELCGMLYHQ